MDDKIMPIPESLMMQVWDQRISTTRKMLVVSVTMTVVLAIAIAMAFFWAYDAWQRGQAWAGIFWMAIVAWNAMGLNYNAKDWKDNLETLDATRATRAHFQGIPEDHRLEYLTGITRAMINLAAADANVYMAKDRAEKARADQDGT